MLKKVESELCSVEWEVKVPGKEEERGSWSIIVKWMKKPA